MKIYIYKLLIASFLFFFLFHLTFGYLIRSYENKLFNSFSKEKIIFLKYKIRDEIKQSLKKDKILNEEDATLIKQFINKINAELSSK